MEVNSPNQQTTTFHASVVPSANATLICASERRSYANRLEILNEVGRQLTTATTEIEVFNKVAKAIFAVLGTQRVSYAIPDESNNHAIVMALTGEDTQPSATKTVLVGSGIEAAIKSGQPLLISASESSNFVGNGFLSQKELVMGVVCPVYVDGQLVATLNTGTENEWERPNESLTLVSTLSRFMGTTLEKIRAQDHVKATMRKLEHRARHDELTGLANRSYFRQLLEEEIKRATEDGAAFSLLFIDLDDFKEVNDSLSHSAGDELLRLAADRMKQQLRPEDTVARLGGDEFVILLRNIKEFDTATRLGSRLIEKLRQPFMLVGQRVQIAGSIGLSIFPDHGRNSDELMMHADLAMYAAKSKGRNNCQIYRPQMSDKLRYRLEMDRDLRQAKENNDLFMMFQPQFEKDMQSVIGVEALIRWQHLIRGNVKPIEFMSVAEESGFVCELTSMILEQSLSTLAEIRKTHPDLYVSVNLSAKEFANAENLHRHISEALASNNLPGNALELELTEHVFLEHADIVTRSIEHWKQRGIRLAIDDFGTGFSSLNYLLDLNIDTIKIDRCFVEAIQSKPRQQGVVKTILELASTLGASCVAEGIETQAELECLVALGCERFQGFLFGRPMTLEHLTEFLGDMDAYRKASSEYAT